MRTHVPIPGAEPVRAAGPGPRFPAQALVPDAGLGERGADGGLEKTVEFYVTDVEQYVDGQPLVFREAEPNEGV